MDGNVDLDEEEKPNRLADYKARSVICDQEERRLQFLADQKRKREKTLNDFRNSVVFTDCDDDDEEHENETMDWECTKRKNPRLKDLIMFSEWMVALPEDFESKWLFVLCPVGKRCLVKCSKGKTLVYGKRGEFLSKFQSALPNGSRRDSSRYKYSNSEVTILDCIWEPQSKSYFVLDLLSWKGQFYMDTQASFRAFWIKSKLEELPTVSERSELNAYPFIPLEYYNCDLSLINSTISNYSQLLNGVELDGILFYHSEAYYNPGSTPLVLWLKPFMLPEIMDVMVPEFFERIKPSNYVNMEQYILESETKKSKKRRGKKEKIEETEMVTDV